MIVILIKLTIVPLALNNIIYKRVLVLNNVPILTNMKIVLIEFVKINVLQVH